MTRRLVLRFLLAGIALPALGFKMRSAYAAEPSQRRVVRGVVIYLGVIPAEILKKELQDHADPKMHDGVPPGEHVYHVMVALFDEATGRRISDAQVALDVADVLESGKHAKLEPMAIGGQLVYGNFINLPGTGPYRLTVFARLQGMPDTIEVEFSFEHARI